MTLDSSESIMLHGRKSFKVETANQKSPAAAVTLETKHTTKMNCPGLVVRQVVLHDIPNSSQRVKTIYKDLGKSLILSSRTFNLV